jgi:hypothetical protein
VAYPENFFRGGVQQIQLTEGRENGDLGAVVPWSGVPPNLQVGKTCILIRFLGCIFHGTGNSARLCQNFGLISGGGGFEPPNTTLGTPVAYSVYGGRSSVYFYTSQCLIYSIDWPTSMSFTGCFAGASVAVSCNYEQTCVY